MVLRWRRGLLTLMLALCVLIAVASVAMLGLSAFHRANLRAEAASMHAERVLRSVRSAVHRRGHRRHQPQPTTPGVGDHVRLYHGQWQGQALFDRLLARRVDTDKALLQQGMSTTDVAAAGDEGPRIRTVEQGQKQQAAPRQEDERDTAFVVFILASNKDIHFEALVDSLLRCNMANGTHIVVSHDGHDSRMERTARRLRRRFRVSQIFHPFACRTAEERHGFPKYSQFGRVRQYWQYTCAKHHWFWAMHRVWHYFRGARWLYYLEEDFLVSKHIGSILPALMKEADARDDVFGAMSQCRDNLWTVSGLMKRAAWDALLQRAQFFCTFDEYNWDLTMKQAFVQLDGPTRYLCPLREHVFHTGIYGKGLTHGSEMESREELRATVDGARLRFYAKTDTWTSLAGTREEHLHTPHAGLRGFGVEDATHCLYVHQWFQDRATKRTA
ncbi:hypothetical protein PTSG_09901 [Salpingoeca rosetta]|uniref:Alpha-1,6-mannosyl-glycoprotein 2-beta-N-acetylglucosaminyltransferase n=1 Tax=Salpingoeca rosetta (strain ATCC 50818 / BSB-021) TaxID=946362 RepID=F2UNG5_SALR5|nr:uncharacterized protein PTSG_09901 [Salpingoeca rosetta]EGD79170.1 hypothetical protein PTSG_09901 [Salpingoeca rosetta]|eukprot:XP_004989255.1 hypothetical protein PTSG_09901 [Salpingoeca rosetta]